MKLKLKYVAYYLRSIVLTYYCQKISLILLVSSWEDLESENCGL